MTMMFMTKNLSSFVVVFLLQVLQFGLSLVHATASSSPSPTPTPNPMSTFSPGSQSEGKLQKMDSHNQVIMALVISLSALGLIVLFLMCLWIYQNCCSKKSQKRHGETKDAEKGHVLAPMFGKLNSFERVSKKGSIAVFDYKALEKGTNNFRESNILGEGGYGRVYKAQLNGRLSIAVKKISHGGPESQKEFQNEVVLLTKIQHPNVISLLGYCIHEETRLLVFELMHNGSLESQLHGPSHGSALNWHIRLKIALDIARGLDYLLEHCNPPVIHRDLKSSNILLDSSFNAKLSDFGLAVTNGSQDKNSAKLSGTLGCVAPEYLLDGKLTDKSDVYSFGVVLLELLLGRKPVEKLSPSQCQSIVTWAMPQLTDRSKLPLMVDPVIRDTMDLKHLYQVAAIAVLCVQPEPSYRPLITDVLHSLVPLVPVELGGTLRVAKFSKPEP